MKDSADMSDAEEAMDGSVSGDEAEQEQSPEKEMVEKPFLWGAGEIIEGKRAKKSVERLDMQVPKTFKLTIEEGSGEKLGDIPRIGFQLNKTKPDSLVPLHSLLFDRRGKLSMIKKNIRLFSGFSFDADSEQFTKKRDKLQKNKKSKLLGMCEVLDLEKKGSHSDLVDKIMAFLLSPKSSGKRLPKKKKRSKKNLSGEDGKSKKKPSKKRSSKQKPSSTSSPKKSKAIVMDSSSDEDEEEEEKAGSEESEAGSGEESGRESGDAKQSESDEESPKPKARGKTKKSPAAKKTKAPSKKPAKKRSRKEATDSESESSVEEEQPKKKKSKPAAKTKKADSSSKTNNTTADDSSDEDEPLSKMVRKTPSDEQLKETVQSLLKEANLEELTMKQICQKVFDEYSEHDLSSKKDFIKQTVKSLIT